MPSCRYGGTVTDPVPPPAHWEADVAVRDGRTVRIRPITSDDGERLAAFHRSLSDETVYFRFFAPYPELTERDVERFTTVDHVDRVALVATVGGELVGVGRYDRVDATDAEVAFVIRDDHQGRGLGSVLLEHLAAAARDEGGLLFAAAVRGHRDREAAQGSQGHRCSVHGAGYGAVSGPLLQRDA